MGNAGRALDVGGNGGTGTAVRALDVGGNGGKPGSGETRGGRSGVNVDVDSGNTAGGRGNGGVGECTSDGTHGARVGGGGGGGRTTDRPRVRGPGSGRAAGAELTGPSVDASESSFPDSLHARSTLD
jgi:hypothetical protein